MLKDYQKQIDALREKNSCANTDVEEAIERFNQQADRLRDAMIRLNQRTKSSYTTTVSLAETSEIILRCTTKEQRSEKEVLLLAQKMIEQKLSYLDTKLS
ncbi:hypothetical protein [Bacillus sp. CGMCC 1.16541]|uniref:hypothetical protein n=1 Tax=Bacillus sp. CGMCC 1.16541 TaxID=2185143 RepID=UPI000D731D34|nr:hypothetical protein [Bacillus sp. CGMCC 1.16541]